MTFNDLTDEDYRIYVFPGGSEVEILEPKALHVAKSGGHRVLDESGLAHYIPKGRIHLYCRVKEGKAPFSFL